MSHKEGYREKIFQSYSRLYVQWETVFEDTNDKKIMSAVDDFISKHPGACCKISSTRTGDHPASSHGNGCLMRNTTYTTYTVVYPEI